MTVLAMATQKGGVGKTTSTVNIAAVAARILGPNKVLVVDVDPQANTTGTLIDVAFANGPRRHKNPVPIIREVLRGEASLSDALQVREFAPVSGIKLPATNLHLLPSHPDLGDIEMELISKGLLGKLADILDEVRDFYDIIILDCPPNLGAFTRAALLAVDHVIIPVSPGPYELVGIGLLQNIIREYQSSSRLNPHLTLLGVLPTLFTNTRVSRDTKSALEATFKGQVLPVVPDRVAAKEAAAANMDILTFDSSSDVASAYVKVTMEVLRRMGIAVKPTKAKVSS